MYTRNENNAGYAHSVIPLSFGKCYVASLRAFPRRISRGTSSRDSYHIFLFHGAGKTIKRRHINNHSFAGGSLLAQARLFFPLTFLFPPMLARLKPYRYPEKQIPRRKTFSWSKQSRCNIYQEYGTNLFDSTLEPRCRNSKLDPEQIYDRKFWIKNDRFGTTDFNRLINKENIIYITNDVGDRHNSTAIKIIFSNEIHKSEIEILHMQLDSRYIKFAYYLYLLYTYYRGCITRFRLKFRMSNRLYLKRSADRTGFKRLSRAPVLDGT